MVKRQIPQMAALLYNQPAARHKAHVKSRRHLAAILPAVVPAPAAVAVRPIAANGRVGHHSRLTANRLTANTHRIDRHRMRRAQVAGTRRAAVAVAAVQAIIVRRTIRISHRRVDITRETMTTNGVTMVLMLGRRRHVIGKAHTSLT